MRLINLISKVCFSFISFFTFSQAWAASDSSYNCQVKTVYGQKAQTVGISISKKNVKKVWSVSYVVRGAEPKDDLNISAYVAELKSENPLNLVLENNLEIGQWVDNNMEDTIYKQVTSPVQAYIKTDRSIVGFKGQAVLPFINNNKSVEIKCKKSKDTPPIRGCLFCT